MAANALRQGLPEVPSRMRKLPVDARGYPIPWFVATLDDGSRDFRVADGRKGELARAFGYCWVCGEIVGKFKTFVIGPMCAVNRVTAEPACHEECAIFSALACPFLTLPKARRNDANMPEGHANPGGEMITRNPGVSCLWTTLSYRVIDAGNGLLYRLSEPTKAAFYTQKRLATRAEVLESIDSGYPILNQIAEREGPGAVAQLRRQYEEMLTLLPAGN